jgi:hypothetical protein
MAKKTPNCWLNRIKKETYEFPLGFKLKKDLRDEITEHGHTNIRYSGKTKTFYAE